MRTNWTALLVVVVGSGIILALVLVLAGTPRERLTARRAQNEMAENTTTARLGREIGKVRLFNMDEVSLEPMPRPVPPTSQISWPLFPTLTPVGEDSQGWLDIRFELQLKAPTGEVRSLSVQADMGSQYLVLMGDTCTQCSTAGGTFPARGGVPGTHTVFTYGIGTYTGAFHEAPLQLPNGGAGRQLRFGVVKSATPCRLFFPDVPMADRSCNDAIAGLLPSPLRAPAGMCSFLDQVLQGRLRKFELDLRVGRETLTVGAAADAGAEVPLLSPSETYRLLGLTGIPYYLVKLRRGRYVPNGGRAFDVPVPPYALLDSGTTLLAAATRYSEEIVFGRSGDQPGATLMRPGHPSVLDAGPGELLLEVGESDRAALRVEVPGPAFATQVFSNLTMMNSFPFNQVLLVGLVALRGRRLAIDVAHRMMRLE